MVGFLVRHRGRARRFGTPIKALNGPSRSREAPPYHYCDFTTRSAIRSDLDGDVLLLVIP